MGYLLDLQHSEGGGYYVGYLLDLQHSEGGGDYVGYLLSEHLSTMLLLS